MIIELLLHGRPIFDSRISSAYSSFTNAQAQALVGPGVATPLHEKQNMPLFAQETLQACVDSMH